MVSNKCFSRLFLLAQAQPSEHPYDGDWVFGLNSLFSTLAFGTLVANFIGCFLMGILVAAFWLFPQFSPEWRLFLVTGFLGALTTFSSFSGEVIELFFKEEWVNGLFVLVSHLVGCLIFTVLGIYFFRFISLLFHFR